MWEIDNYDQVITFLLSLCLGAMCCALYDILRALRKVCLNSFLAVNLCDILLWIIYAFATFIFLISRTNGEIRGYVILGEAIGFVLFRISLSKILFKSLSFIFIKLTAIKRKIGTVMSVFYIKSEICVSKTLKYIIKIFKSIKKVLKSKCKLLYTYVNIVNTEKSLNETETET